VVEEDAMGIARSRRCVALVVLGLLAGATTASAAKITWSSPSLISGPSDVSTQGTVAYAYSLGNNVVPQVNGVFFTAAVSNNGTPDYDYTDSNVLLHNYIQYTGFSAPSTVSDTQYQNLLTSAGYAPGPTNQMVFTLNVTSGQTYLLEVWANDARGSNFAATESVTDPSGGLGSLTISQNYASGYGGSFITGTFLADASTQQLTFTWSGPPNGTNQTSQVNAFQLRNITPTPEPASTLALGIGAFGLLARRRRA
jgi:PEP-CTERM motif-containing protein